MRRGNNTVRINLNGMERDQTEYIVNDGRREYIVGNGRRERIYENGTGDRNRVQIYENGRVQYVNDVGLRGEYKRSNQRRGGFKIIEENEFEVQGLGTELEDKLAKIEAKNALKGLLKQAEEKCETLKELLDEDTCTCGEESPRSRKESDANDETVIISPFVPAVSTTGTGLQVPQPLSTQIPQLTNTQMPTNIQQPLITQAPQETAQFISTEFIPLDNGHTQAKLVKLTSSTKFVTSNDGIYIPLAGRYLLTFEANIIEASSVSGKPQAYFEFGSDIIAETKSTNISNSIINIPHAGILDLNFDAQVYPGVVLGGYPVNVVITGPLSV